MRIYSLKNLGLKDIYIIFFFAWSISIIESKGGREKERERGRDREKEREREWDKDRKEVDKQDQVNSVGVKLCWGS